jgi:peptidoglycan/LPS O-acetylase OafA/YrhL
MVFATHLYWNGGIRDMGPLTPLGHTGSSGVVVFFVLSGYLIYRPFAGGASIDLGAYAVRRFLRIYPAYIAALVGVALVFGKPDVLSAPLAYATLMQGLSGNSSALVPSWTLTAEVLFYAAAPPLAMVVARASLARQLGGLACLGAISFAGALGIGSVASEAEALYLGKTFPLLFWAFVPGMAIAALKVHGHPVLARARSPLMPVIGLGLVWLGLVSGLNPWANLPIVVGAAAIAAWIVVAQPRVPRIAGAAAAISYGFYLWQYDIVEGLVSHGVSGVALVVLALVATAAAATGSYLFLERPAIRLGRRLPTDVRTTRSSPARGSGS